MIRESACLPKCLCISNIQPPHSSPENNFIDHTVRKVVQIVKRPQPERMWLANLCFAEGFRAGVGLNWVVLCRGLCQVQWTAAERG
jgi:hypothetical protein